MTYRVTAGFNRRGFLKSTALGALAATLPFGGAQAAPKRGGHLRVGKAHGETTDTLDPGTWGSGFDTPLSFAIHGHLTEVAPDGTLAAELAESWEATPDAKTWRLKIRKGVSFHSGKPLTVEDVIQSINHHRGEDSTSVIGPLVKPIVDVRAEGDDTVVVDLDAGNADFPFTLTDYHMAILPATADGIDWRSGDGCGSYVLKSFKPGVSVELARNPNHWRDNVAWFDTIEMIVLFDQNARTTALTSGDVHAIDRLDLKTVGLMARQPDINISSIAGTQHYTFAMSSNQAPFDNNHVRQALKYAVNREELVEKILFGYGSLGNDVPIGQGQRYFNTELEQRPYDPDKAKWHLKQAGLDSVSVTLSAADAAYTGAVDAAVLYQNSAKAAGIDIKVIREANDGYWADVWRKKPFTTVYWGGRPVEDQMFSTAYACGGAWNDTFFCNDRFEELMIAARAELNNDTRRSMYFEMQQILRDDGGAVIPMFANYVFGTSNKIGLPETMGSNWDMDGERWAERWWFA
ncbi:ABC transporter substrate-binding protein [Roseovarius aestuarii]|nr:ABC transporter substrate-binding protein [Roseovarius aestuarii]